MNLTFTQMIDNTHPNPSCVYGHSILVRTSTFGESQMRDSTARSSNKKYFYLRLSIFMNMRRRSSWFARIGWHINLAHFVFVSIVDQTTNSNSNPNPRFDSALCRKFAMRAQRCIDNLYDNYPHPNVLGFLEGRDHLRFRVTAETYAKRQNTHITQTILPRNVAPPFMQFYVQRIISARNPMSTGKDPCLYFWVISGVTSPFRFTPENELHHNAPPYSSPPSWNMSIERRRTRTALKENAELHEKENSCNPKTTLRHYTTLCFGCKCIMIIIDHR